MNSVEFYEGLRDILEPMYDVVGLGWGQALNCDRQMWFIVQKYGPTQEAINHIFAFLGRLHTSPLQLEWLSEMVGEDMLDEMVQPLSGGDFTDALRRLSEAWGPAQRPTASPHDYQTIRQTRPQHRLHTGFGRIMECDTCSRVGQSVLYGVGKAEICNWCYGRRAAAAWRTHNKRQVRQLASARRLY